MLYMENKSLARDKIIQIIGDLYGTTFSKIYYTHSATVETLTESMVNDSLRFLYTSTSSGAEEFGGMSEE